MPVAERDKRYHVTRSPNRLRCFSRTSGRHAFFRVLCSLATRFSSSFSFSLLQHHTTESDNLHPNFPPTCIGSCRNSLVIFYLRASFVIRGGFRPVRGLILRGFSFTISSAIMGSEIPLQRIGAANVDTEAPTAGDRAVKKNQKKVPRKIHKAEREKLKREQLNDLFLNLADALDLTEPNNGKASILNEATRLLKDLFYQIECLKKENVSLLSESRYVATEKNELVDENYTLEMQIGRLQNEINTTVEQSKPDLNVPLPEFSSSFAGHVTYGAVAESNSSYRAASNVRKPHARYPTPADSWPSQLLRERQREGSMEFMLSGHKND